MIINPREIFSKIFNSYFQYLFERIFLNLKAYGWPNLLLEEYYITGCVFDSHTGTKISQIEIIEKQDSLYCTIKSGPIKASFNITTEEEFIFKYKKTLDDMKEEYERSIYVAPRTIHYDRVEECYGDC